VNDIQRSVSAERLKVKRTLALWLAAGAPLAVVSLNFLVYTQGRGGTAPAKDLFVGFAQINLTLWTIVVLPLYAALAAALVGNLEHQTDNWKHLLALPVSRRSIFAAKWVVGFGLLLVSSLVLIGSVWAAAALLRLIKPAWRTVPIPAVLLATRTMQSLCAAGLLFSIQMWVSLRWRSFIGGLAVGIVGVMILFGGVLRAGLGTVVVYLYPWAMPPTAMARMWESHADRPLVAVWGVVSGAAVAELACWELSRREFQ
jgi:hypothetical protein